MSTNCVRCVVNHRAQGLYCQSCGDSLSIVGSIMLLTHDEAATVTILPQNEDGPPNYAVIVNQQATNWLDERFTGNTLAQALDAAACEMVKRTLL